MLKCYVMFPSHLWSGPPRQRLQRSGLPLRTSRGGHCAGTGRYGHQLWWAACELLGMAVCGICMWVLSYGGVWHQLWWAACELLGMAVCGICMRVLSYGGVWHQQWWAACELLGMAVCGINYDGLHVSCWVWRCVASTMMGCMWVVWNGGVWHQLWWASCEFLHFYFFIIDRFELSSHYISNWKLVVII